MFSHEDLMRMVRRSRAEQTREQWIEFLEHLEELVREERWDLDEETDDQAEPAVPVAAHEVLTPDDLAELRRQAKWESEVCNPDAMIVLEALRLIGQVGPSHPLGRHLLYRRTFALTPEGAELLEKPEAEVTGL